MLANELVSDLCESSISLETLMRMSKLAEDVPRALVAYGLGYFASRTDNAALREKAIIRLTEMKSDNSEDVRSEAEAATERIAKLR